MHSPLLLCFFFNPLFSHSPFHKKKSAKKLLNEKKTSCKKHSRFFPLPLFPFAAGVTSWHLGKEEKGGRACRHEKNKKEMREWEGREREGKKRALGSLSKILRGKIASERISFFFACFDFFFSLSLGYRFFFLFLGLTAFFHFFFSKKKICCKEIEKKPEGSGKTPKSFFFLFSFGWRRQFRERWEELHSGGERHAREREKRRRKCRELRNWRRLQLETRQRNWVISKEK